VTSCILVSLVRKFQSKVEQIGRFDGIIECRAFQKLRQNQQIYVFGDRNGHLRDGDENRSVEAAHESEVTAYQRMKLIRAVQVEGRFGNEEIVGTGRLYECIERVSTRIITSIVQQLALQV